MYNFLLHTHSGLRWVFLAACIMAVVKSFQGKSSGADFQTTTRKFALIALITAHLQLVFGLVLYFISPAVAAARADMGAAMKDGLMRFVAVEHVSMMILGIFLITFGWSSAKRGVDDIAKHKKVFVFYAIGLIVILASIPWPFLSKFANYHWF